MKYLIERFFATLMALGITLLFSGLEFREPAPRYSSDGVSLSERIAPMSFEESLRFYAGTGHCNVGVV